MTCIASQNDTESFFEWKKGFDWNRCLFLERFFQRKSVFIFRACQQCCDQCEWRLRAVIGLTGVGWPIGYSTAHLKRDQNVLTLTFESEEIFGSNFQRMVKNITNFLPQIFRRRNAFLPFLQQKVAKVEFPKTSLFGPEIVQACASSPTSDFLGKKLDFCNFLL